MANAVTRQVSRPAKGKGKAPSRAPRASGRSPSSSGSDANSGSDDGDRTDQSAMLAALQAHSRSLLGLDGPDEAESSTQAQLRPKDTSGEDESGDEFEQSDDGWGAEDGSVTDSEEDDMENPQLPVVAEPSVPEVVFAPQTRSELDVLSKAERKAFLLGNSAKMMGIKREDEHAVGRKRPRDEAEEADDHSKLKLDKTLHEMLLNNLLPSAAAAEAQRPVDKRNAMHGRLLELASYALPGEGSNQASSANAKLSSHPAKIRTGIIHAQAKREANARREAELAGNKGLGENPGKRSKGGGEKRDRAVMGADLGKKKGMEGRKKGDAARDRGLGMGIGKFDKGMLRLSEREIARGSGERRGGSGRGGRGGRGGKKGRR